MIKRQLDTNREHARPGEWGEAPETYFTALSLQISFCFLGYTAYISATRIIHSLSLDLAPWLDTDLSSSISRNVAEATVKTVFLVFDELKHAAAGCPIWSAKMFALACLKC